MAFQIPPTAATTPLCEKTVEINLKSATGDLCRKRDSPLHLRKTNGSSFGADDYVTVEEKLGAASVGESVQCSDVGLFRAPASDRSKSMRVADDLGSRTLLRAGGSASAEVTAGGDWRGLRSAPMYKQRSSILEAHLFQFLRSATRKGSDQARRRMGGLDTGVEAPARGSLGKKGQEAAPKGSPCPAQNERPVPVTMITQTEGSSSAQSNVLLMSLSSCGIVH